MAEPFDWENDEETLENWLLRDPDTDNHDIVAIIPKTLDEAYDNEVTFPRVVLLAHAPKLLDLLKQYVRVVDGTYIDAPVGDLQIEAMALIKLLDK